MLQHGGPFSPGQIASDISMGHQRQRIYHPHIITVSKFCISYFSIFFLQSSHVPSVLILVSSIA